MRKLLLGLLLAAIVAPICSAQSDLLGFEEGSDTYYIFDRSTGDSTTNGTVTVSAQTVTGVTGAALHPTTHVIYCIVKLSAVTGRTLCTFDPTTGVATVLGSTGNLGDNFSSLAFDSAGVLYGTTGDGATTPETLYTINLTTGVPTFKVTLGNGADGEMIAYNPVDGLMYHSSGNGTVVWESINLTTNAVTTITPPATITGGEFFGMVWDPEAGHFLVSNISDNLISITTAGAIATITPLTDTVAMITVDVRGMILLPEIIPSTTTLNLGTTPQGTSSTSVSFTVEGTNLWGDITVTGFTGVVVSLAPASGFGPSLNLTPTSGFVATTTVYARIQASAPAGAISGNITLTSNGADTVNIAASGTVTAPAPELDVTRGATPIADGSTDAIGNQAQGPTLSITYTLTNSGAALLTFSGTPVVVATAGTNTTGVAVVAQPAGTLAAAGNVSVTINYQIVAVGAFDFTVSIASDDADENPYNWTVSGMGAAVPEIDVSRSGAVADGGNDAVGSMTFGQASTLTYTITNSGTSGLTITTPVTISGETNCTVLVTTQPGTSVAATASTTLVLSVTPTAAGAFTFNVSIANDDSDENPYNWIVSGTGAAAGGGGGGGGGDDDDDGCAVSSGSGNSLVLLAAMCALVAVLRVRRRMA